MHRVVVLDEIHPDGMAILERAGFETVAAWTRPSRTRDHLRDADAVIVRTTRIADADLPVGDRLRVVAKHGVGVDNIDQDALRRRGIVLVSTPGAAAIAVAEHALMLILAVAKRVLVGDAAARAGDFLARVAGRQSSSTGLPEDSSARADLAGTRSDVRSRPGDGRRLPR